MLQEVTSGPNAAEGLDVALAQSCAKKYTDFIDMMEDVYTSTRFRTRLLVRTEEQGVLVDFLLIEVRHARHVQHPCCIRVQTQSKYNTPDTLR